MIDVIQFIIRISYSNHYIIKFINFVLIYYVINLNIILSYIIFNYLYLKYEVYHKFESLILFFCLGQKKIVFIPLVQLPSSVSLYVLCIL